MGNHFRVCLCFMRKFKSAGEAEVPADVREVFSRFTGGGAHMTAEQLRRFLEEEQLESKRQAEMVVEEVLRRRHHHHHLIEMFTRHTLTVDDFFHFLFSVDLNPAINQQVHQDMNAPLSHYFIFTGHNSYLTGNQLSSDSSDIPIIRALKRGVRVIELDLWPNSNRDKVHVLHGRTLTTPVELMKCLKSIEEHAFSSSPYPVILTLEDHLTPDLQAKVAQMITETFKDSLFYPEQESLKELPSPEELKYKIIISTKLPKEHLTTESNSDESGKLNREVSTKVVTDKALSLKRNREVSTKVVTDKALSLKRNHSVYLEQTGIQEGKENSFYGEDNESDDQSVSSKPPEYTRLISLPNIPRSRLKETIKSGLAQVSRLSMSEETLEKLATSYGEELVRYSEKNMLRIFPKTTRFNSSNYKPIVGWMHGAQMVAFNMQGYGKYLWWMQGLFRANGGCGYVKKPDFLLNLGPGDIGFDPKRKMPVKTTLKVKVYMGTGWSLDFKRTRFNSFSPPDFYTKVGIAGVPADEMLRKTKTKEDHWNPIWDEEFTFPLTVPELALLRVQVHARNVSMKDALAGQTCLPVIELKPGIRAVPLYNHRGERYNSVKLLIRIQFV